MQRSGFRSIAILPHPQPLGSSLVFVPVVVLNREVLIELPHRCIRLTVFWDDPIAIALRARYAMALSNAFPDLYAQIAPPRRIA